MTIRKLLAGLKDYEFLEQESLHQGSVFVGRQRTSDQHCAFFDEYSQSRGHRKTTEQRTMLIVSESRVTTGVSVNCTPS